MKEKTKKACSKDLRFCINQGFKKFRKSPQIKVNG